MAAGVDSAPRQCWALGRFTTSWLTLTGRIRIAAPGRPMGSAPNGLSGGGFWIIDDTGFPKKGKHSVGVARQYCGLLGKQDNCQVAVSVSLAFEPASVPVVWQLYLPREWAEDTERRRAAGIPAEKNLRPRRKLRSNR
ncbi:transposase [Paraburkholderia terrae]